MKSGAGRHYGQPGSAARAGLPIPDSRKALHAYSCDAVRQFAGLASRTMEAAVVKAPRRRQNRLIRTRRRAGMRVLFVGPSGVNLREAVERIADHCRTVDGAGQSRLGPEWEEALARPREPPAGAPAPAGADAGGGEIGAVLTHYVEDHIGDMQPYLDRDGLALQQQAWEAACGRALEEVGEPGAQAHHFLGMHMPHYRKDKFFPIPSLPHLKRYAPDMVITLIDDVHTCYQRIRRRPRTRSNFTLRDILVWRSLSVYAGDTIASSMSYVLGRPVPNYEVAVKHPLSTFERLIFRPSARRVYASFSISAIRGDAGRMAAIDGFRAKLHGRFCVFDPLAIDDRLCQNRLEAAKAERGGADAADPSETVVLSGTERWPLGDRFPTVGDVIDSRSGAPVFPIELPVREIIEIAEPKETEQGRDPSVIDNMIRERDLRMIDQASTVVAYRPNIAGCVSRGVAHEAAYASQVRPKRWYYVWPAEDGPFEGGPFGHLAGTGIPYDDEDALIADLQAGAAGDAGPRGEPRRRRGPTSKPI